MSGPAEAVGEPELGDTELAAEVVEHRGAFQKPAELAELLSMVRERRPRTVVEIGTFKGGTLYGWCRVAHPEAVLVTVDLPGGLFGGGYSRWEGRRFRRYGLPGQRVHTLRRDSHDPDTVEKVRELLEGSPIDFLMIDGDHTYEGVKRDWELYEPLVAPGGLIALHDIVEHDQSPLCKVDEFWSELAGDHETRQIAHSGEDRGLGRWGGIGVVFKGGTAKDGTIKGG